MIVKVRLSKALKHEQYDVVGPRNDTLGGDLHRSVSKAEAPLRQFTLHNDTDQRPSSIHMSS